MLNRGNWIEIFKNIRTFLEKEVPSIFTPTCDCFGPQGHSFENASLFLSAWIERNGIEIFKNIRTFLEKEESSISNIIHAVVLAPSPSSWSHLNLSVRFSLPRLLTCGLLACYEKSAHARLSLSSSFTRSTYSPRCPLSRTTVVALARSSSSSTSGQLELRSTSSLPGTTASPDCSSTSIAGTTSSRKPSPA
jgi:hypothetical protein